VTAGTEALISTVAAAVAAVFAAAAVVVAVIALIIARSTLKEARETTEAQRETLGATETLVHATEALTTRIEASTRMLHLILGEAQATRELEQLRRVADQVAQLVRYRRAVRQAFLEHNPPPWHDHNDAQTLLAAHLEGLAAEDLPKCREMVTADPRYTESLDAEASNEIKKAIGAARTRLDGLAAAATAELTRAQGNP
jgi:hypothetical protein